MQDFFPRAASGMLKTLLEVYFPNVEARLLTIFFRLVDIVWKLLIEIFFLEFEK